MIYSLSITILSFYNIFLNFYFLIPPFFFLGNILFKIKKFFSILLEKQVKEEKLAGAEFLVARNNKIVMHSTRGFSNLAIKKKLNKNSIYFIQSMTKPIISVAIMQLYERDLLDFDDEISKYIPEAAGLKVALDRSKGIDSPTEKIKTPITIGQLLSHFSGLSHGLWNNKLDRDIGKLIYGVNYPFFTDYSLHKTVAVSYTHLTLPTKRIV